MLDEILIRLEHSKHLYAQWDGINDVWLIEHAAVLTQTKTQIFDRYGSLIFSSDKAGEGWDGTKNGKSLPVGVYYYRVDQFSTGDVYTGSITLIR